MSVIRTTDDLERHLASQLNQLRASRTQRRLDVLQELSAARRHLETLRLNVQTNEQRHLKDPHLTSSEVVRLHTEWHDRIDQHATLRRDHFEAAIGIRPGDSRALELERQRILSLEARLKSLRAEICAARRRYEVAVRAEADRLESLRKVENQPGLDEAERLVRELEAELAGL